MNFSNESNYGFFIVLINIDIFFYFLVLIKIDNAKLWFLLSFKYLLNIRFILNIYESLNMVFFCLINILLNYFI